MQQNQERSHVRKTVGNVAMGIGLGIFDSATVIANIQAIEAHNTGPIQIMAFAIADGLCLISTYWYAKSLVSKNTQEESQERRQRRSRRVHETFRRIPRDPHTNSRQRGR